ncbi:hypothetical protein M378DRAFT_674357 [Amanita muscaria Koide BX008]|uniref:Uncharacterized protein n=1 Tax=Amanita muscaria (strain Koide BX008) TaxID=946122 RepID=A0A0C2WNW4_AMAMK|nr:hypothetical protein M378DRAFT_674357 [Amanita muscaria Koide BX008]
MSPFSLCTAYTTREENSSAACPSHVMFHNSITSFVFTLDLRLYILGIRRIFVLSTSDPVLFWQSFNHQHLYSIFDRFPTWNGKKYTNYCRFYVGAL